MVSDIFKTTVAGMLVAASLAAKGALELHGFDVSTSLVPADEIMLGGPPRDGIPAIDRPVFVGAGEADFLSDNDRVLGLFHKGEARAYPLKIMDWHEVVNDRVGGDAIAVTYCPLCLTGIAFDAGSDVSRTFGVSGLLYNSNVLLYDRETESLWSQLKMQAISGPEKGRSLEPVPLQHTSWAAWQEQYPDTQVLSLDTGFRRDYDRNPYTGYATNESVYFPVSATSARYHPKEQVLGLSIDGRVKAYPFTELAQVGSKTIEDLFGDQPIRISFDADRRSAVARDENGNELPGVTSYWFAWYAFHPDTEVFTVPERGSANPTGL
jgi:hypothetical protein